MSRHDSTHPETLATLRAFRELDAQARSEIAQHCHTQNFQAGENIIILGEANTDVFFLAAGQAKATVYSEIGRQFTLQAIETGSMFGELAALDNKPRSAYVIALTDALVISMSQEAFMETIYRYPEVARATLQRLCGMVRHLSVQTHRRNTLSAQARICAELLRLAATHKTGPNRAYLKNPPTHAEMATFVGTSRETVSREMSRLRRQGLLISHGRAIEITDVARLMHMIE